MSRIKDTLEDSTDVLLWRHEKFRGKLSRSSNSRKERIKIRPARNSVLFSTLHLRLGDIIG